MVNAATKTRETEKPWEKYRGEPDWKDLIPGYAGAVDEQQVAFIQEHLMSDDQLSYWWGWKSRGMKRRAVAAIERVAMLGDPESRAHNVKLVREAGRRAKAGNESDSLKVTKAKAAPSPRLGRPRIAGWESDMLRMAGAGVGVKGIAKKLRDGGMEISHMTVARRLKELRGQLSLV
jgi:hypothetical protein